MGTTHTPTNTHHGTHSPNIENFRTPDEVLVRIRNKEPDRHGRHEFDAYWLDNNTIHSRHCTYRLENFIARATRRGQRPHRLI